MDNYQDSPKRVHSQRNEALLVLRIGILDRHRIGITKGLLGVGEADLVLGEIRPSFGGIEFDLHEGIMHYICILSRARRLRPASV